MVEGILHVHQHEGDIQRLQLAGGRYPSKAPAHDHHVHGSRIHRDLGPHIELGTAGLGGETTFDSGEGEGRGACGERQVDIRRRPQVLRSPPYLLRQGLTIEPRAN